MTVTLTSTDSILRSRLIDVEHDATDDIPVYGFQCGSRFCDNDKFHQGRLIDLDGEVPVYGIASECGIPPCNTDPPYNCDETIFYEQDTFPPGISERIKVVLHATQKCDEIDCVEGELYRSPSASTWTGTIAGLEIELWVDPLQSAGNEIQVSLGGCAESGGLPISSKVIYDCVFPLRGSVEYDIPGCCECLPGESLLYVEVQGYTNRFQKGRLIDVDINEDGPVPVYGVAECCEEVCTPTDQTCCDLLTGCDLVATVAVTYDAGCDCTGLDGTYSLPWDAGQLYWSSGDAGPYISACDRGWVIKAECLTDGDGVQYFRITLYSVDPTCDCTGYVDVYPDTCSPLEVSGEITITCTDYGHAGLCCGFTVRITVSR